MSNQDNDEIVDIEEYTAAGKPVPPGRKYQIRLDKDRYVTSLAAPTGRQILELAGKTPELYLLRQKLRGQVIDIKPDQAVDLTAPGVERFMTIPNEVQEGEPPVPRMHFALLPDDAAHLNQLGMRWEAVTDGGVNAIVIHGWPLPDGYNVRQAAMHIRLSNGYPDAQLDMAYFSPELRRQDGRHIGGLSTLTFDGGTWQQWSRHRTGNSAWRMGEDNLSTHLALVQHWLQAELAK